MRPVCVQCRRQTKPRKAVSSQLEYVGTVRRWNGQVLGFQVLNVWFHVDEV